MINNTNQTDTRHALKVRKLLAKKSFGTLGTSSDAHRPHSAGIVYTWVDGALWAHTLRGSRKARNIAANDRVSLCIAFRKLPVGPPFTIHFQASARLIDMQAPEAQALINRGRLKAITGHGELEMEDGVFVEITPRGTIHSFGPGARIIDLIRDPLTAGGRSVAATDVLAAAAA